MNEATWRVELDDQGYMKVATNGIVGIGSVGEAVTYLNALEDKYRIAVEALEAAADKFQRIQWVALPGTLIMARAEDGENDVRAALDALSP